MCFILNDLKSYGKITLKIIFEVQKKGVMKKLRKDQ
jgi:hypothetical protein